jgi:hypothetical protein
MAVSGGKLPVRFLTQSKRLKPVANQLFTGLSFAEAVRVGDSNDADSKQPFH